MQIGEADRILQGRQGGLRGHELGLDLDPLARLVAGSDLRTMTLQQLDAAARVMEGQRLLLHQRLEGKGRGGGMAQPHGYFIAIAALAAGDGREFGAEGDAHGILGPALPGPEGRIHSALARELVGERAGGRGLDELQGPVEIGLADAIGAEEDRQPVDGKADGAQRSIARGMNLSHHQRHGTPRVSFLGSANASRHATDKHAAIPSRLATRVYRRAVSTANPQSVSSIRVPYPCSPGPLLLQEINSEASPFS